MHDSPMVDQYAIQVPPLASPEPEVKRLEQLAFDTIRRTMGLSRLARASELPLPTRLVSQIEAICHQDFVYDTTSDDPDQFREGLYPAISTIDSTPVHISISFNTGRSATRLAQDLSYLTRITKDDHVYYIFARTQRLRHKIRDLHCRQFPAQMAWRLVSKMATQCRHLTSADVFGAQNIHFYNDDVFIRPYFYNSPYSFPPIMTRDMTFSSGSNVTVEENGGATHVLCIGRVVEDMFSWCNVGERNVEPFTNRTSMGRLRILVNDCLIPDPRRRPSLSEVIRIADLNV